MSFPTFRLFAAAALMAAAAYPQTKLADRPGFKDPALFTRMPNYYLSEASSFKESQFDSYKFSVKKGTTRGEERVEGRKVVYCYYFDKTAGLPPSPLQIARNYSNATLKLGGQVLYAQEGGYFTTTLRIAKNGQETWAEVQSGGGSAYYLTMVERQAMQQEVAANAEAMKSGLAENGHVEVAGIFFDFNKSEVKPESQPALAEVVKLLQGAPALKVWVVGHTDNVGSAEFNVTLASARAAAVAKALVQAGIDARRLTPHGDGPYAPVAANTTDEGRARNRRVELVAQP